MTELQRYQMFVGIDVAATTFTAAWGRQAGAHEPARTFAQTPDGFTAFRQRLAVLDVPPAATCIVLEATGVYWITLAVTLHHAGFQVCVVNPRQIHNYARSLPRRSKTDRLDAHLLWQFATERQLPPWTPPPAVYHEVRQRLVARDALLEMRQQVRNQRHALVHWPIVIESVQYHFDALVVDLDGRIAALDAEIADVLQDSAWAESAALLQSIPGIGPGTAAWLLVATLNFEACATPEAAVAYAGLAPVQYESGTSIRGRAQIGQGGHGRLRKALYLATLSATQHNPIIKPFYDRLRAAGKPMKVARCAAARKLLHVAWAVVTKRHPFDPQHRAIPERGQVALA